MVIMKGYKQTEVGVIPMDWEDLSIGECFSFKNGLNKEKHFFGQGTPIVNYMDVYKHSGVTSNDINGKVTVSTQELRNYEVRKGDVFFTRTSETVEEIGITSVILVDLFETVFSGFLLRARPTNLKLELEYKKYCFSSSTIRKQISSSSSYTTRALTNGKLLSKIIIPIPPKLEQTAIATALSDADALITSLEKLIEKKRAIKQGAMQELLTPKLSWKLKKLGEVLKIRHGKSQKEVEDSNGQYPILGTGGLMSYTNHFLYDKPSVLIGRKGTIDKPQFMNSPFWTVDTLFYTEINADVSPKFIYYRFLLVDWYSHNEASGVPSLNAKTIENIEIAIPSFSEQAKIAIILSTMDAEIAAYEQKLSKYKRLKQGMMQELLTGKIRLV